MRRLGVHVRCPSPEVAATLAEVVTALASVDPEGAEAVARASAEERLEAVRQGAGAVGVTRGGLIRLAAELVAIAGRMP